MKDTDIDYLRLQDLFINRFGVAPSEIVAINSGGGSRKYYRLKYNSYSAIGVIGHDTFENETFIRLDNLFLDKGLSVPQILEVSSDNKYYLLQDLGDTSLFNVFHTDDKNKIKLAKKALKGLIRFQLLPEKYWEKDVGFPPFSERLVKWDLNYFKYDFLKPADIYFDEEKLEDDFERLLSMLTFNGNLMGLMYRDFQSRNILINEKKLWYIDFQGARKGPLSYDAVSFIWQAKAPFSLEERVDLMDYYVDILKRIRPINDNDVKRELWLMTVFRTLQVLGAYGFRGLIEKKTHFIESIPYAIANLKYLKQEGHLISFPELERIVNFLDEKFQKKIFLENKLTVTIYSFSYRKGYPEDLSGNGGGFIFDCRFIHNPGRYEEYKDKTGMDKEVIHFIDKLTEAQEFKENIWKIVNRAVKKYIERGFTSLQLGFGCTGGQHRSVYFAEKTGERIKNQFPEINVLINHREQGIEKTLKEGK